jgi:hypothetical protein
VYSPLVRLGKHSLQDLADYLRAGRSCTAIARVYPGAGVFNKEKRYDYVGLAWFVLQDTCRIRVHSRHVSLCGFEIGRITVLPFRSVSRVCGSLAYV